MSESASSTPAPRGRSGPLVGLRVIDAGNMIAGPLAATQLADFGADVIKVESRKRLDPMRMDRPLIGSENAIEQGSLHQSVNRNKRSVAIDISDPRGADLARRLAVRCDVFIENLSPGALEKYGLGYASLSADRPRLIYVSLGAVGREGPLSGIRAYAPVITALAGVDSLTGYPGERVLGLQHGLADPNASIHGLIAVLAALHERDRSGQGQMIDLSQLESLVSLIGGHLVAQQMGARIDRPIGDRDIWMAPHGVYPAEGDDAWVALACPSDESWCALRRLMGDPAWAAEDRYATREGRLADPGPIDEGIARWTATRDRWAISQEAQAAGILAAPLLDTADRFSDDHLQERGLYASVEHPVVGTEVIYGIPWRLSRTPGSIRHAAPLLGQHTREVLGEALGLDGAAVAELEDAGVLT